MSGSTSKRYPVEPRERAVRMVVRSGESPRVPWRLWSGPGSAESRVFGFSYHGDDALAFEPYRGEPSELAVTAFAVVPDLEVLEDRVREFESGVPLLSVEELDLHA